MEAEKQPIKTLYTQRMELRAFSMDDLEEFHALCSQEEVMLPAGFSVSKDREESKKTLDEINGYFENKSLGSIVSDFFSDIFKPNSSSDSNGDEYVNMLNDYVSRYTDSVNTSSEVAQKSSESLKNLAEGQ